MLVPDRLHQVLSTYPRVQSGVNCVYTPAATFIWKSFKVNYHTDSLDTRLRAWLAILIQRQVPSEESPTWRLRNGKAETRVQGILNSMRWFQAIEKTLG